MVGIEHSGNMRTTIYFFAAAALANLALAQDKVTLNNGDVITGKVVSMADGRVTIQSPALSAVVVALTDVADMVTGAPVALQTISESDSQSLSMGLGVCR